MQPDPQVTPVPAAPSAAAVSLHCRPQADGRGWWWVPRGTLRLAEDHGSSEPCLASLGRTPQVLDYLRQAGAHMTPEASLRDREAGAGAVVGRQRRGSRIPPASLPPANKTWLGPSGPTLVRYV